MGNWYKIAIVELHPLLNHVDTFKDRNIINGKIRELKGVAARLLNVSKGGYQDIQESRTILSTLIANKTLSSYPHIIRKLEAAFSVSLDNYGKMMLMCEDAMGDVYTVVRTMEKARREFVEKTLPEKMKEKN